MVDEWEKIYIKQILIDVKICLISNAVNVKIIICRYDRDSQMQLIKVEIMNNQVIYSYAKLWKLLIDKKMNKTQLKETAGISTNAVAKLGRNEPVSLETIGKICYALQCDVGDIIEIVIERKEF